jgi:endonuclease-8
MEGPGVRTIADRLASLAEKQIASLEGRSRFPLDRLVGGTITRIYPVGKLLFIEVPPCALRVHFLMWGRYRLNGEIPGKSPKLTITFDDGSVLRFYASAIALLTMEEAVKSHDPSLDPMDSAWDVKRAIRLVKGKGREQICDTLMDQAILPGVGNVTRTRPSLLPGCIRKALRGVSPQGRSPGSSSRPGTSPSPGTGAIRRGGGSTRS